MVGESKSDGALTRAVVNTQKCPSEQGGGGGEFLLFLRGKKGVCDLLRHRLCFMFKLQVIVHFVSVCFATVSVRSLCSGLPSSGKLHSL
jgi:hypothetical protein